MSAILVAALALAGSEPAPGIAVGTLWTGTGSTVRRAVVSFEGGRVRQVSEGDAPPNDPTWRAWPDAWASPGLVDAHAYLGARDDLAEDTFATTPDARAIDCFEPGHRDFERAARAGITAVLLSPRDENLVGGVAAVVKTAGPPGERIVRAEALLKLSLGAAARRGDREPTSKQGAVALLRADVDRVKTGLDRGPFGRFVRGDLAGIVNAGSNDEVFAAGRFGGDVSARLALLHAPLAGEMAAFVKERRLAVVCGPYRSSAPLRALRSPALLAEAGVEIAFCTDGPDADPEALRLGAALAVRSGLDPERALRALTTGAAEILGVADRVGSIAPGKDADLVVWSGPPLDLGSRVLAVFVNGVLVHDARARVPRRPGDPIVAEAAR